MSRSLMPREHGAYGQLAVPLATALAIAPSLAGACFVLAAVAVFLAHEPALVLLGHRGRRVLVELRDRARRRLGVLSVVFVLAAGAAALGSPEAVWTAMVPAAGGLVVGWLALRKTEKTLFGEVVAGATLAAVSVPVLVAGGMSPSFALGFGLAWALGFAAATAAVLAVIAKNKRLRATAALLVLSAVTVLGAVLAPACPPVLFQAPSLVAAWVLVIRPPHPRRLRVIGWTLVAAIMSSAFMTIAWRYA